MIKYWYSNNKNGLKPSISFYFALVLTHITCICTLTCALIKPVLTPALPVWLTAVDGWWEGCSAGWRWWGAVFIGKSFHTVYSRYLQVMVLQSRSFQMSCEESILEVWDIFLSVLSLVMFQLKCCPGPWFNIKMSSYQYRKSHCGNKTILWPSYLHNGISYTGKTTSLYWIGDQVYIESTLHQVSWLYSCTDSSKETCQQHSNGLVQERRNSSALAME